MNNSPWLSLVKSVTAKKAGQFTSYNICGIHVVIDWHITDILSGDLALFKKEVSDLAAHVTAGSEVTLLQEDPQAVHSGGFFKVCEPLFSSDVIDWFMVEETLQSTIKQFYLMDISLFGHEVLKKLQDDIYFFASIKDQRNGNLLGFLMSSITPALPYGDIKIINLVVQPNLHRCGLEQLLFGSLLKVIPIIKRMFIFVRPTNQYAIEQCKVSGFTIDKNPVQDQYHIVDARYFAVFEYKTDESDILQKHAILLNE